MYLSREMPPEAWSEERRLYLQATLCQMKWFFIKWKALGRLLFFRTKREQLFQERQKQPVFQILLTGKRALNILFHYAIKSKNDHIK